MNMINKRNKSLYLTSLFGAMNLMTASAFALTPLTDEVLGNETGQAAFFTNYVAPSGAANSPTDFGFFTLGLNGTVELNTNIQHLQLGCGGANGANGCDIDINNLGLSGNPDGGVGPGHYAVGTARAATDAVLQNPFFQLAIKNPTVLATRQLVGFNLGAQRVIGLLTAGTDNPASLNNSATDPTGVGINALSGFMKVASSTGTAMTAQQIISYNGANTPAPANGSPVPGPGNATVGTNTPITGRIYNIGTSCFFGCTNFTSTNYDLVLPATSVALTSNPTTINSSRVKSIALTGTGDVSNIYLYGQMTANAIGLNLAENIPNNGQSYISNLKVDLQVQEALSYIHNITVDNPVSLSLQSTDVYWPGSTCSGGATLGNANCNIAKRGWWMGFGDTVNIGSITPTLPVSITVPVLQNVLGITSQYLYDNPISCGTFGLLSCLGGTINVGQVDLAGNSVPFPLKNLVLAAQTPKQNCYGNLKFC